jgi:hypothetical protein
MMGLEPTTFCMAKPGERSRPFAPVRSNHLFAATTGRASEPQRTRTNTECSHCSHCDCCHVQLAWPGGVTPPERPARIYEPCASTGHASSFGFHFRNSDLQGSASDARSDASFPPAPSVHSSIRAETSPQASAGPPPARGCRSNAFRIRGRRDRQSRSSRP